MDVENSADESVSQRLIEASRADPAKVQRQMAGGLAERLVEAINAAVLHSVPTLLQFPRVIDAE